MNNTPPLTRADVEAIVAAGNAALADRLIETMRDIETHLLTEFHRYAKGQHARVFAIESNDAATKQRLHEIEERLLELERRIRPEHSA